MKREKLADILFWSSVLFLVVLILWALLGNSPTTTQLISGLGVAIIAGYYRLQVRIESLHGDLKKHFVASEKILENVQKAVED